MFFCRPFDGTRQSVPARAAQRPTSSFLRRSQLACTTSDRSANFASDIPQRYPSHTAITAFFRRRRATRGKCSKPTDRGNRYCNRRMVVYCVTLPTPNDARPLCVQYRASTRLGLLFLGRAQPNPGVVGGRGGLCLRAQMLRGSQKVHRNDSIHAYSDILKKKSIPNAPGAKS